MMVKIYFLDVIEVHFFWYLLMGITGELIITIMDSTSVPSFAFFCRIAHIQPSLEAFLSLSGTLDFITDSRRIN